MSGSLSFGQVTCVLYNPLRSCVTTSDAAKCNNCRRGKVYQLPKGEPETSTAQLHTVPQLRSRGKGKVKGAAELIQSSAGAVVVIVEATAERGMVEAPVARARASSFEVGWREGHRGGGAGLGTAAAASPRLGPSLGSAPASTPKPPSHPSPASSPTPPPPPQQQQQQQQQQHPSPSGDAGACAGGGGGSDSGDWCAAEAASVSSPPGEIAWGFLELIASRRHEVQPP